MRRFYLFAAALLPFLLCSGGTTKHRAEEISPEPSAGAMRRPTPEDTAKTPQEASEEPPEDEGPRRCPCRAIPWVFVRNGDIFFCSQQLVGDEPERLTSRGDYRSAHLSPSGEQVVALRHRGRVHVPLEEKNPKSTIEIDDNRVELIDVGTQKAREVGRNGVCTSLYAPHFLDDSLIVVSARGFEAPTIHNQSACIINLPRGGMHRLTSRGTCGMLVPSGRFRGMVFTSGFSFKVGEGLRAFWRVVDRQGRVLREFSENPLEEDRDSDGITSEAEARIECEELEELPAFVVAKTERW